MSIYIYLKKKNLLHSHAFEGISLVYYIFFSVDSSVEERIKGNKQPPKFS